MRVQVCDKITMGGVVMYEYNVYDMAELVLDIGDFYPPNIEELGLMILDRGEWVKGWIEGSECDENGEPILAELDGDQLSETVHIRMY